MSFRFWRMAKSTNPIAPPAQQAAGPQAPCQKPGRSVYHPGHRQHPASVMVASSKSGVTRVGLSECPCLPSGAIESSVVRISSQIDLHEHIFRNSDCHKCTIDQTRTTAKHLRPTNDHPSRTRLQFQCFPWLFRCPDAIELFRQEDVFRLRPIWQQRPSGLRPSEPK